MSYPSYATTLHNAAAAETVPSLRPVPPMDVWMATASSAPAAALRAEGAIGRHSAADGRQRELAETRSAVEREELAVLRAALEREEAAADSLRQQLRSSRSPPPFEPRRGLSEQLRVPHQGRTAGFGYHHSDGLAAPHALASSGTAAAWAAPSQPTVGPTSLGPQSLGFGRPDSVDSSLSPAERHHAVAERCRRLYLEGRLEGFEVLRPEAVFGAAAHINGSFAPSSVFDEAPEDARRELAREVPAGGSATVEHGHGGCGEAPEAGSNDILHTDTARDPADIQNELAELYQELHRRMGRAEGGSGHVVDYAPTGEGVRPPAAAVEAPGSATDTGCDYLPQGESVRL